MLYVCHQLVPLCGSREIHWCGYKLTSFEKSVKEPTHASFTDHSRHFVSHVNQPPNMRMGVGVGVGCYWSHLVDNSRLLWVGLSWALREVVCPCRACACVCVCVRKRVYSVALYAKG